MTAAGFLPICYYRGKLLFLFGLESPAETSAKGWSDFAGGLEKNEKDENEHDIYRAALREMSEEMTGFLGGPKEIDELVKKNGGFYKYVFDLSQNNKNKRKKNIYHIHLFRLDYDEKLIEYYNNNHKFLYKELNHSLLSSTKVFEKIKIKWFTIDEMKTNRSSFRPFYREIIDKLIYYERDITFFLDSTTYKNR